MDVKVKAMEINWCSDPPNYDKENYHFPNSIDFKTRNKRAFFIKLLGPPIIIQNSIPKKKLLP